MKKNFFSHWKLPVLLSLTFLGIGLANISHAFGECTKYGIMSVYDYLTDSCKCMTGYAFQSGLLGTTCVSMNTICRDRLGYNSRYDSLSDQCKCSSGYVLEKNFLGDLECVSCFSKYGLHSSYSYLSETCKCDDGYTLDDSGQCVEKQNNIYFFLKELDTDSREAIIKSNYDYRYYLIHYGVGCLSSTFERYVNGLIVVNLGTDFDVDTWDKVVLQNDDQTCNITQKESANSSTTLAKSELLNYGNYSVLFDTYCKSKFGQGAIGLGESCYCGAGYELNNDKTGCTVKQTCPINSTLISNVCTCNQGLVYNPISNSCVDYNTSCQLSYGQNSYGDANYCYCNVGYEFNSEKISCVTNSSQSSTMNSGSNVPTDQTSDQFVIEQIQKLTTTSPTLINKLKGKILLQVQTLGAAWYLHPVTLKRYYLKDGPTAYEMLRAFGLGISEADYTKITAGNLTLKTRLKGKIILRAQAYGEAYYINPKDLSVTYLKDGEAAYQAMRNLSLGISDIDIYKIPIEKFEPVK